MKSLRKSKKLYVKRVEEISGKIEERSGFMGISPSIIETGIPDFVYVRFTNNQFVPALNKVAPIRYNLAVKVKKKPTDPYWEVVDYRQSYLTPSAGVKNHHTQHEFPSSDTVWIRDAQIIDLLVLPIEGFSVNLYAGSVQSGDHSYEIPNQILDLSSYQQTSEAKWLLIGIEEGVITYVLSDAVSSPDLLVPGNLPPATSFDLCAIKMYSGQESIQRNNFVDDFIDLRFGRYGDYARNIWVTKLPGATYEDVQSLNDLTRAAGHLDGGEISDAGSETIDVTAGQGLVRGIADDISDLFSFDWPETLGLEVPTDTLQFVVVEYNSGSPQVVLYEEESYDYQTAFPIGFVVNEAGTLYINNSPHNTGRAPGRLIRREYEVNGRERANFVGGLILGETGTRNVTVSEGVTWFRDIRDFFADFDTSISGTFDAYYRDGVGGFIKETGLTQWPNDKWDDGSGTLATMNNNNYNNLWFYLGPGDFINMVYGRTNDSNIADVVDRIPPADLPLRLRYGSLLLGRIIFKEGEDTAEEIQSAFDTVFSTSGGGGGAVESVNGKTGVVVLDPDDLDDSATTHKFTTAAEISKLAGIEAGADVTDLANVGSSLNGAASDTPLDADTFHFWDAVDTVIKKITWANIKATLKTYFDTLYANIEEPIATTHIGLSSNAHEADAISVADAGAFIDSNNVEAAIQEMVGQYKSGWMPKPQTWTRTGNFTFTMSGDHSADPDYQPSIGIRCKQGGGFKYGTIFSNVHSGGTTTITLVPNNDFTLTAATITDMAITKSPYADGFPTGFNYTPSGSSALGTGSPGYTITTTITAKWHPRGKQLRVVLLLLGTTTGTTVTSLLVALPVTAISNVLEVPTANYGVGTPRVGTGALTTTDAVVRAFDNSDMGIGTGRIFRWSGMIDIG